MDVRVFPFGAFRLTHCLVSLAHIGVSPGASIGHKNDSKEVERRPKMVRGHSHGRLLKTGADSKNSSPEAVIFEKKQRSDVTKQHDLFAAQYVSNSPSSAASSSVSLSSIFAHGVA